MDFTLADKFVSSLLAFIGAVYEGPRWSFSNAVEVFIIICLRSFNEDGQSAPTSF